MYRWVEHTAEVELEIEATSEREVFASATRALAELLGFADTGAHGERDRLGDRRTVSARATDRPALLASWLEELVFLAESDGFVATALASFSIEDGAVHGEVIGLIDDPPPLVKAVTLHRLLFEAQPGGYLARVVLDV